MTGLRRCPDPWQFEAADARGRISQDRQRIVDAVEPFREAARERGCYGTPLPFAGGHARFRYFRPPEVLRPDSPAWDDRARGFLRERRSFVWDGTNLSRQLRGQTTALAADYGARVRIAYVEAPEAEMRARNRARPVPVPDQAIARMLRRWEMPTLAECHELRICAPSLVPAA